MAALGTVEQNEYHHETERAHTNIKLYQMGNSAVADIFGIKNKNNT